MLRSIAVRVALFVALASPIALWVIAGYYRGALAGGGPVLAASFAGFLSIGVQSMIMNFRSAPETVRGELGLFGASVAFFGGCLVSAVIESGGIAPVMWVHLAPPLVIGVAWASLVQWGSASQRPLDIMLDVLATAEHKQPIADKIVDHLAGLEESEDAPVYATAVLIVTRPLVDQGCAAQAERLLAQVELDQCPPTLQVLISYELVLARLGLEDVPGAKKALPGATRPQGEAEAKLIAAARAHVLVAEGKHTAALASLQPYETAQEQSPGSGGEADALDEHAGNAVREARAVVQAGIDSGA